MHDMGCVREVEQAAVSTLMAEFARLQAILGEDLTQSLSALRSELEAASEALSADMLNVLNLCLGDPGFSRVKELLQKHHQSVSMKVNLPLIELEAAKEDLDRFLQECLRKLGSGSQVQEALGDCSEAVGLQSKGLRDHQRHSRCGATRSIQLDCTHHGCGTAYGGGPSARDPGQIVRKAQHASSRCG